MLDVVYACNNFFISQTAVSMVSLVKYNKDIRLHLVSDNISSGNLQLLKSILDCCGYRIDIIDADMLFKDICFCQQDRHPRTIYAKFFLDDIVLGEKALYLDSDTVINGPLIEMEQRDMEAEVIAGVLMPYSRANKAMCGLSSESPYICDGVVLFNMIKWKVEQFQKKCIEYINQYGCKPPMQSEGTLNNVCQNNIGILKPEYNVMPSMLFYTGEQMHTLFRASLYYDCDDIAHVKYEQKIIHFMNELYNRPWFTPSSHPLKAKYLELENALFGGETTRAKPLSWHTAITVWLAKHIPFTVFVKMYYLKNGMKK